MKFKELEFKQLGDNRGEMVAVEGLKDIPFEIKRLFYSYKTSNESIRGSHANKDSKFVFIALSGSCKIKIDDGFQINSFEMNSPEKGLFIDKMVWKDMYDFTEDCILLVISDCQYNSKEYIKNYSDFKNHIKLKKESK